MDFGSTLVGLAMSSDGAADGGIMDTEVLGDLRQGVVARGMCSNHGRASVVGAPFVFGEGATRAPALHSGDLGKGVGFGESLHVRYEGIAAEINVPSQFFPQARQSHPGSNEVDIGLHGCASGRSETDEDPIRLQPGVRLAQTDHGPIGTPGPLAGIRDHIGADRVQDHIAGQFEKMGFLFDQDRLEPPLEDMTGLRVRAVEPLREYAVQMPHALRKVAFRRFDDEVVVVGHLAPAMTDPIKPVADLAQYFVPDFSISVTKVDRFAPVAARRHVIEPVRQLNTQGSRHGY